MDKDEIITCTTNYIRENFLYTRPDYALGPDAPLFGTGIIDSMGVMELIVFLEGELGIEVDDEEIIEENFGSVATIAEYVQRKQRARKVA